MNEADNYASIAATGAEGITDNTEEGLLHDPHPADVPIHNVSAIDGGRRFEPGCRGRGTRVSFGREAARERVVDEGTYAGIRRTLLRLVVIRRIGSRRHLTDPM